MSQNSMERLIFRAMRYKMESCECSEAELKEIKETLLGLSRNSHDDRVRHHSCETLLNNQAKMNDQRIKIEEIENPVVEKKVFEHQFPQKLVIEHGKRID